MNISPALQQNFGRIGLQLQKHAPTILTVTGVTAVTAATFFAAKNTLKLEAALDEGKDRLRWANEQIEAGDAPESFRAAAYVKNVLEVAKLYFVPTGLLIGGIVCILSGQNILNKRNAALAAAYNGLAASYDAYRERVREEYGEEAEKDIFLGQKTEIVEDEKGKKTKVKRLVDGEHSGSPYRFYYDQNNDNWTGFNDQNLYRLQMVQNMYNDILRARGHVLLHEVLDTLGIERTPASVVTGWIYDPENENHFGDDFIEFNIRDYQAEKGYFLLDMNVDGTIFDKI
jgi:hypothetical protein